MKANEITFNTTSSGFSSPHIISGKGETKIPVSSVIMGIVKSLKSAEDVSELVVGIISTYSHEPELCESVIDKLQTILSEELSEDEDGTD